MAGIGIRYGKGEAVLPQIGAVLEVARRENLSRAAEALFVSQPTLTARLQSLEAALGEQLFVRTRRGMRLTEAGDAFLPYAEHALRALADGRERLDELRRGMSGWPSRPGPPRRSWRWSCTTRCSWASSAPWPTRRSRPCRCSPTPWC